MQVDFPFLFSYVQAVNADRILAAFQEAQVDYLLIGGMNFLLRHKPVLTFDIDFWIRDEETNLVRVNKALHQIEAQWGITESVWAPVPEHTDWLVKQGVFCLTTPYGAVDIFRSVKGLEDYETCRERASLLQTQAGVPYRSLSDSDMLACQLALEESDRRLDRVAYLQKILER